MRNEDAVPMSRCAPQTSGWWLFAILAVTLAPAAPAQTFTVLHAFTGSPDGSQPQFGVILDRQGNVFGNTWAGGCTTGCDGGGTIYKIDTTGTESVLYAFGNVPNDAFHPNSQLLIDGLGNLYGVTQNGGSSGHGCQGPGCGTGYRIAPDGTETILFNFPSAGLTQLPNGPLLLGVGGVYGTADGLADSEDGAVYKFDGAGISVLHQFTGGSDGAWPFYGLTQDASGNLFGVTYKGGAHNFGTVFKIDPSGVKTNLHDFSGGAGDGAYPDGTLTLDGLGSLYGVTYGGGSSKVGVLYQLAADGTLTVLHSFTGGGHAAHPGGALISDSVGGFYGYATAGGGHAAGTIYHLDSAGNETTVHAFTGTTDGSGPNGLNTYNGALYGTTLSGGDPTCNCGVVFKVTR